jgi:hypothetical protein
MGTQMQRHAALLAVRKWSYEGLLAALRWEEEVVYLQRMGRYKRPACRFSPYHSDQPELVANEIGDMTKSPHKMVEGSILAGLWAAGMIRTPEVHEPTSGCRYRP